MLFSKGKIKNISKIMNADMFKPLMNIESGIIIVLILGFSLLFAYTLFVKTSIIEGIEGAHEDKDGDKDKGEYKGKDTDKGKDTNPYAITAYADNKKTHSENILSNNRKGASEIINTTNPK